MWVGPHVVCHANLVLEYRLGSVISIIQVRMNLRQTGLVAQDQTEAKQGLVEMVILFCEFCRPDFDLGLLCHVEWKIAQQRWATYASATNCTSVPER